MRSSQNNWASLIRTLPYITLEVLTRLQVLKCPNLMEQKPTYQCRSYGIDILHALLVVVATIQGLLAYIGPLPREHST
ncbi:hypothetical protein BT63DRAFT_423949 [Microthyrium microscopicum]|uniref:Uncharacterized protein n=1 Tax=Microthyrium microscopicum TaxID=703497 RepID=A0A6A6UCI3_9PEZI|nr:hypothetical protein BT63DRAFT_423949 [Microthyrium microscopicum]